MTKEEIIKKIELSFKKILQHDNFSLTIETTASDVDGWESITHMLIINDIEEHFNIKFKLIDLMKMENIGDLISAIKSEINK